MTTLFNKHRPDYYPMNGTPLDDDDSLLEPSVGKGPLSRSGAPVPGDDVEQPRQSQRTGEMIPTITDQLHELKDHVDQAREMTSLLVEAIEFTEAAEVEKDPIIRVRHSWSSILACSRLIR